MDYFTVPLQELKAYERARGLPSLYKQLWDNWSTYSGRRVCTNTKRDIKQVADFVYTEGKRDRDFVGLVAFAPSGSLVGATLSTTSGDEWSRSFTVVRPDYRRSGIGSRLLLTRLLIERDNLRHSSHVLAVAEDNFASVRNIEKTTALYLRRSPGECLTVRFNERTRSSGTYKQLLYQLGDR